MSEDAKVKLGSVEAVTSTLVERTLSSSFVSASTSSGSARSSRGTVPERLARHDSVAVAEAPGSRGRWTIEALRIAPPGATS